MENFTRRVAVVTGGASGIGRAMAERFAEEGMRIVLADVERDALAKAEAEMRADGAEVIAVPTDVSKPEQVEELAAKAIEAYGGVHILCNNAGVAAGGAVWDVKEEDWEWVIGVNLMGVIHGIRSFVPHMLERGEEGHIVNVASIAGLMTQGWMSPYHVTKHGVVALSECLYHELAGAGGKINVSVLCPGWVKTRIAEADRNRPGGPLPEGEMQPETQMLHEMVRTAIQEGLSPKEVAELVFQSIVNGTFYILPHPHWNNLIQTRMEDILQGRPPTMAMLPTDSA